MTNYKIYDKLKIHELIYKGDVLDLDVRYIRNQVKGMIALQGWTLTNVVTKINESRSSTDQTSVQNISNKLARGTIKYSEVLEIAEIIGIDISWTKINHTENNDLANSKQ